MKLWSRWSRPYGGSFSSRKIIDSRYIILSGSITYQAIQQCLAEFYSPTHCEGTLVHISLGLLKVVAILVPFLQLKVQFVPRIKKIIYLFGLLTTFESKEVTLCKILRITHVKIRIKQGGMRFIRGFLTLMLI